MNSVVLKPVLMGAIAGTLERYVIKETNMTRNLYFGTAVAVGNYASQYIAPLAKDIVLPSISKNLYDTPTLVERIAEVSSSTTLAYLVNKYVLQNDPYTGEMMTRIAIIAGSDFASTYILDYANGQPLEFLTNHE